MERRVGPGGIRVPKLSARNQFAGTVLDLRKGATTTLVRIEVAPGVVFTASITVEAAEELGL